MLHIPLACTGVLYLLIVLVVVEVPILRWRGVDVEIEWFIDVDSIAVDGVDRHIISSDSSVLLC